VGSRFALPRRQRIERRRHHRGSSNPTILDAVQGRSLYRRTHASRGSQHSTASSKGQSDAAARETCRGRE
jgi:hypothetical protein